MNKNRFCWIWGVGAWGAPTGVAFAVVMSRSSDAGFLQWLVMWRALRSIRAKQTDGDSLRL